MSCGRPSWLPGWEGAAAWKLASASSSVAQMQEGDALPGALSTHSEAVHKLVPGTIEKWWSPRILQPHQSSKMPHNPPGPAPAATGCT